MLQNHYNTSRAEELRDQWDLLSRQISELERDRITETRTEERFRLDQVITRTKENRWRLEKELQELEAQTKVNAGTTAQSVQEDLCPPWLREQLLRRFRNDLGAPPLIL
ncbi:MAG: hypothetical protein D3908_01535 [Candidatus Electrothrix sp. AUS4]|nr:hypothetical protein [Candidatus Electrothrix sp. AUS4]